ncbi:hypothetical protein P885DRAFT_29391 [Corynascus similis CBS 632.67]
MQTSRFQSITARFSPHNLRSSFRRSSTSSSSTSSSSRASSADRASFASLASSSPAASIINSIVLRRKSELELCDETERPPHILEPMPVAHFCSLEERMMSF